MSFFEGEDEIRSEGVPLALPQAGTTYSDPATEMASRQLMDAYFNPEYGMINQQIPIPVQQIAGLSPQEVQARNLAQGLGGFGQQLSEAQNLYRVAAQGFDPRSVGAFAAAILGETFWLLKEAWAPLVTGQFKRLLLVRED